MVWNPVGYTDYHDDGRADTVHKDIHKLNRDQTSWEVKTTYQHHGVDVKEGFDYNSKVTDVVCVGKIPPTFSFNKTTVQYQS